MTIDEFAREMNLDEKTKGILTQYVSYRHKEMGERLAKGLHKARARGVKLGRPRYAEPEFNAVCERYFAGEISLVEATRLSGASRSTLWRRGRERKEKKQ